MNHIFLRALTNKKLTEKQETRKIEDSLIFVVQTIESVLDIEIKEPFAILTLSFCRHGI